MQKPKTSVGWIVVGRRHEPRQFALATPLGSSRHLLATTPNAKVPTTRAENPRRRMRGRVACAGPGKFFPSALIKVHLFFASWRFPSIPAPSQPIEKRTYRKNRTKGSLPFGCEYFKRIATIPLVLHLRRGRYASDDLTAYYLQKYRWMAPDAAVPPWLFPPAKLAWCL